MDDFQQGRTKNLCVRFYIFQIQNKTNPHICPPLTTHNCPVMKLCVCSCRNERICFGSRNSVKKYTVKKNQMQMI